MNKHWLSAVITAFFILFVSVSGFAAEVVPLQVQMPGTQPGEVGNLNSGRCANCHGGYASAVEPVHTLRGSMMAHAGRDPIFWATLAVAEQDFDGSGDLCIRCHMHGGWQGGRSTPTDGSALTDSDAQAGVECDLCHRLTNPDQSEHLGIQNAPFIAHDGGTPAEGHYGSGQTVIWNENSKLGPYDDAEARHGALKSAFHRSADMCGTCHDVSNPVVGDLAHNNGAQTSLPPGTFGGPGLEDKAAFNHAPYQYGVVERTYSEHKASLLAQTPVSAYSALPADLRAGAIERAYLAATAGGGNGDYEDGTPRLFSCQTCHMAPAAGAQGCNKNPRPRPDMPVHDLTGGNYWMPEAIQWLDSRGALRLGGGLTAEEIAAMNDGILRAQSNLEMSATLSVTGNTLKVVNLTGHKLISGYPEGRRMWLNIRWYDSADALLREDGAYGALTVEIDGAPIQVNSLLDPQDANTKVYEAHGALTQEWAGQLLELGYDAALPVSFDRVTGEVTATLGDVAAAASGSAHESFHFVLNNKVVKDNRIPPYGMRYDESVKRNILPVPADQYGNPGPGGVYDYWDEIDLNPPAGAAYATIQLLYQPTSWEYIQFLYLANRGANAFLADEGRNLLDAWLATGMAAPYVMVSATWGTAPSTGDAAAGVAQLSSGYYQVSGKGKNRTLTFVETNSIPVGEQLAIRALVRNEAGEPVQNATVSVLISGPESLTLTSAPSDAAGLAEITWQTTGPNKQGNGGTATGSYTAATTAVAADGYVWDEVGTSLAFDLVQP
jgi:hypothetical protein